MIRSDRRRSHAYGGCIALSHGGSDIVGRNGCIGRLCLQKAENSDGRPNDPPDGRSGGICFCGADDQFHHPGDRIERTPGGWDDPRHPAGPSCGLSRDGLDSCRSGTLLRRRRALGARLQYLEPRVLPLLPGVSADLQAAHREESKSEAHPVRFSRGGHYSPSARRFFRCIGNASVRQERTALRRFPAADAADSSGDRDCRRGRNGRDRQLCVQS